MRYVYLQRLAGELAHKLRQSGILADWVTRVSELLQEGEGYDEHRGLSWPSAKTRTKLETAR